LRPPHNVWPRRYRLKTASIPTDTFGAIDVDGDMTNLAGASRCSRPEFSVQNDRATDSVTDADVENVARVATGAGFVLAKGGRVRIVLEFESQTRHLHQLRVNVLLRGEGKPG